jgi:hypothetical protein
MEESKQNKMALLRQMIENAERNVIAAKQLLSQIDNSSRKSSNSSEASQIVEGTFDGEKMMGLDGKTYPIPVNYASKSKLIEGDLLKLTITEDGSFVYKQISPADRRKIMGIIMKDSAGKYYVSSEGRKYKVLLASLTYFKAKEGDEVTLVVPKEKISKWAAIEAVIENSEKNKTEDNSYTDKDDEVLAEENSLEKEAEEDDESIEDEWTPDLEEMKKEARFDKKKEDDGIFDELG